MNIFIIIIQRVFIACMVYIRDCEAPETQGGIKHLMREQWFWIYESEFYLELQCENKHLLVYTSRSTKYWL